MSETTTRVEKRLRSEHREVLDGLVACADAVVAEWASENGDWDEGDDESNEGDDESNEGDDESNEGDDESAAAWTTDRDSVVPALEHALDASGLLLHLPNVLADLVSVTGHPMPAPPVAAPPYVVVTSEGVLLRASLDGARLVVSLRVFAVEPDAETRYVRRDGVAVGVELR
ncbi:hypothetical protein [Halogeometricum limi]|uniref:DUF7988 domain-containing protein n=1 Tax=Halogeometricum limi TaxID=555875 RepID=A0A1I6HUQ3_9EURY|nr:hypothetical protein [Halogeometricum limi]SFR58173.1 hypothetical protein SAMN04488124_2482 [Halogeometricum limi]